VSLLAGLLLIGAVVYQWWTEYVSVKIWGPWRIGFHRDEWPAFFWSVLAVEVLLAGFFVYWFFA
jgi:hypothetical protein